MYYIVVGHMLDANKRGLIMRRVFWRRVFLYYIQPLAALVATRCTNYRELKTFDIWPDPLTSHRRAFYYQNLHTHTLVCVKRLVRVKIHKVRREFVVNCSNFHQYKKKLNYVQLIIFFTMWSIWSILQLQIHIRAKYVITVRHFVTSDVSNYLCETANVLPLGFHPVFNPVLMHLKLKSRKSKRVVIIS